MSDDVSPVDTFKNIIAVDTQIACPIGKVPKKGGGSSGGGSSGGGSSSGYIQHGGTLDINRWAEHANIEFSKYSQKEDYDDSVPSSASASADAAGAAGAAGAAAYDDSDKDKKVLVFCKLIIFVEILHILNEFIEESLSKSNPPNGVPSIITYIIDCINEHLTNSSVVLAYFRSIFGGTTKEQVATAVCAGAAAYSSTYLPLFINLLFRFISNGGENVKYAIDFVAAYMPAPVLSAAGNYASVSGVIAIGFMVYGFMKPIKSIPDPSIVESLKSITQKNTVYHSLLNFVLDITPVKQAIMIPSNVKGWFNSLKNKFKGSDPASVTSGIIIKKFVRSNDVSSTKLINFSGSFKKIMKCIWDQIKKDPGDEERDFFTAYYNGVSKHYESSLGALKTVLQRHALSLIADDVLRTKFQNGKSLSPGRRNGKTKADAQHKRSRSQLPSLSNVGSRGGSSSTVKRKRKNGMYHRNNNNNNNKKNRSIKKKW